MRATRPFDAGVRCGRVGSEVMNVIQAALLVLALLQSPPAQPPPQLPALLQTPAVYPPVRNASVVHAFGLPDDVKADAVRKSLAELSTKEADCRISYGPMRSSARPQKSFVVVEAPASVDVKDVIKALKKGAASVEPMAWTCFQSSDPMLGAGLAAGMPGLSPRDFILGLSNDLRWVEARGGFSEFFFTPGKLDAAFIQDRFHKLAQPFGIKDVGAVVVETITWPLAEPVDPAAAKRAEKELLKIAGVKSAKVDAAGKSLEVKVALDGLVRGAPPITLPGGMGVLVTSGSAEPETDPAPRMRFDTNTLFGVLDKEKLAVLPPAKESEVQGGK